MIDATLYLRRKRWSVQMGRGIGYGFTAAQRQELWDRYQRGESSRNLFRGQLRLVFHDLRKLIQARFCCIPRHCAGFFCANGFGQERPFAPADLELFDRLRNVERGPLRPFPPCKKAARSELAVVGADDDVILP